ncbi:MAG: RecX family transcriptional regulator [Alistipes sp.]|nr:RecX family transcriptional regulator [Alistipes sp.]
MAEPIKYRSPRREKKPKSASEALASLMRLCSRAEKSSGDAMRLMAGWGVPPQERAAVLEKLTGGRFIDDRRFAEAYVRDKLEFSGWGPYKIDRGLAAKGIPREIISEVTLRLGVRGEGRCGRLAAFIEKKARRTKYKDIYDLKGKLLRFTAGQGYPYDEAAEAIELIIRKIKVTGPEDV